MSNDIHKYKILVESIILDESYKDAKAKFSEVADEKEITSYIDLFKELGKTNKTQGIEKDISYWIRNGWTAFKEFVDSKRDIKSKREQKSVNKKDSIHVYSDNKKIVVVPLTKKASIEYGSHTKWCTAATKSKNHFVRYFYINHITLFYVLFKDGAKYAAAFSQKKPDVIECFDTLDKSIKFSEFSKITGISKEDIQGWYSSNKSRIEQSRDLNTVGEEEQLEVVKQNGFAIEFIDNPSEAVQLAAVTEDGYAIDYIANPSEAVQLAAVQQDGGAIKHIASPSEEVQLAAVKQKGFAIQYISNPSEAVQLTAVQEYGDAIHYIIKKGIVSREEVQLAAVQQDGGAIKHIASPSEEVQLAAVKQDRDAIEHIKNPTEKVKVIDKHLWGRY